MRARHEEIQKIERDLVELSQMFNDLDALVVQQEAPVTEIERRAGDVSENVVKGNEEIKGAIDKAKARNRKKWWCVLISRKCAPEMSRVVCSSALTSMQLLFSLLLSSWSSWPYSSPKSEICNEPRPSPNSLSLLFFCISLCPATCF